MYKFEPITRLSGTSFSRNERMPASFSATNNLATARSAAEYYGSTSAQLTSGGLTGTRFTTNIRPDTFNAASFSRSVNSVSNATPTYKPFNFL